MSSSELFKQIAVMRRQGRVEEALALLRDAIGAAGPRPGGDRPGRAVHPEIARRSPREQGNSGGATARPVHDELAGARA